MLASIVDPVKRSEWKRAMIDAQLCSEVVVKSEKRDKSPRGTSNGNSYVAPTAED